MTGVATNKLCRICKTRSTHPMHPIFIKTDQFPDKTLADILFDIAKIDANVQAENSPPHLCETCSSELKNAYKFVLKAQNTHKRYVEPHMDRQQEDCLSEPPIDIPMSNTTDTLQIKIETDEACEDFTLSMNDDDYGTDSNIEAPKTSVIGSNQANKLEQTGVRNTRSSLKKFSYLSVPNKQEKQEQESSICASYSDDLTNEDTFSGSNIFSHFKNSNLSELHESESDMSKNADKDDQYSEKSVKRKPKRKSPKKRSLQLSKNQKKYQTRAITNSKRKKKMDCKLCGNEFEKLSDLRQHVYSHIDGITGVNLKKSQFIDTFYPNSEVSGIPQMICADFAAGNISKFYSALDESGNELHMSDSETENESETNAQRHVYRCELCNKEFNRRKSILSHQDLEHTGVELPHGCSMCEKRFVCSKLLQHHLKTNCRNADKKWQCPKCTSKFVWETNLENHLNIKHSNKWQCDECGSWTKDLLTHKRNHIPDNEKLDCPLCDRKFVRKDNLQRHMKVHSNSSDVNGVNNSSILKKMFLCNLCGKALNNSSNLAVHMRRHIGEKPFKCENCDKAFPRQADLAVHLRTHTGEKPYKCTACEKAFSQSYKLQTHFRIHSGERPYKCEYCNKGFIKSAHLAVHCRTHTGEKPYKCTLCEKAFPQPYKLQIHMRIHSGERPYKCPYCEKSFAQSNGRKKHVLIHTGEKPYVCDICDQRFIDKRGLIRHQIRRHKLKDGSSVNKSSVVKKGKKIPLEKFLCALCGKAIMGAFSLKLHMQRHNGERPYKCEHCDKGFLTKTNLVTHNRIHTGEKPYKCTLCEKTFAQPGRLQAHVRIHTGERPYKCTYCEKSFAQFNDCTLHVRTHTGERPYVCDVCEKRFIRGTDLKNHRIKRDHFGKVDTNSSTLVKSI